MPNFRIFTEGKADIKFIADYVLEHFNISLIQEDFFALNSWSGYKADGAVIADIRQNFEKEKKTILILDADDNFDRRKTEVLNDFQGFNIPVHLFLFPQNSTTGNLESILTQVAVERKLIECFLSYEQCVNEYAVSLDKARIYSYLDTLLPADSKTIRSDLRKEENRNYRNPAHWNLQHEYLQPLHDFLSPFFIDPK